MVSGFESQRCSASVAEFGEALRSSAVHAEPNQQCHLPWWTGLCGKQSQNQKTSYRFSAMNKTPRMRTYRRLPEDDETNANNPNQISMNNIKHRYSKTITKS